ncbi:MULTISPECIES: hypothetical protein [unclassified Streptomyces]|uniref:hypothetical protein n=1 Tax=unclassified Streptomyces TaxID=2593676 RepID=UPI002E16B778|nr:MULTISPECIES: hypothetical protein [unclassified Streptomyces]
MGRRKRTPRAALATTAASAICVSDPVVAEEQVRHAWALFFNSKTSVAKKAEVAENSNEYELMIEALAKDPKTRALRVDVQSVAFTSNLHARVTYTLSSHNETVAPAAHGASVRQNGTWKVHASPCAP